MNWKIERKCGERTREWREASKRAWRELDYINDIEFSSLEQVTYASIFTFLGFIEVKQ